MTIIDALIERLGPGAVADCTLQYDGRLLVPNATLAESGVGRSATVRLVPRVRASVHRA